ncbi:MAG: hypothetical protein IH897_09280, partial [Planctomycetes bacterium]|nr:hypothetical protein [Planctomycetota bacterium]
MNKPQHEIDEDRRRPGITLDGLLTLQSSGVVDAPVTVNPTGQVRANSSFGTLNGDVTVLRDGDGAGRLSVVANNAHLNGTGVVTNSGLIEGGAISRNASTFFDLSLTNTADGVVRAFRNGTPTNTFFQITEDVQNNGVMEAVGANLYFTTARVQNAGLLHAVDNEEASKLIFINGTRVTDSGGTTTVDGGLSRLEVSAAANVELGTLSFTNGGGGFVSFPMWGGMWLSFYMLIDHPSSMRRETRNFDRLRLAYPETTDILLSL